MAATDQPLPVTDAGPIIHLDELGRLGLLVEFGTLLIPREVWIEVARHRSALTLDHIPSAGSHMVDVTVPPSPRLRSLCDSFRLDAGEMAALQLMESRRAQLLLCDDAAGRLAGESLGFTVRGTIGVLVRSIRRGLRSREEVIEILRQLPDLSTLHISRELLATVIGKIEQAGK